MVYEGVTTAIVGFIFVCLLFPNIVKNAKQFYAALGLILGMMFLQALAQPITSAGFRTFVIFATFLLQIGAIAMLVFCVNGLSPRQLSSNFIEVMRRGETEKEYVAPGFGKRYDDPSSISPLERVAINTPPTPSGPRVEPAPASSPTIPLSPPPSPPSPPSAETDEERIKGQGQGGPGPFV